ncbi:hypothetical protein [Cypionkella sp. TWP1-2-1b2]|uniref:hypothetical protein n=1 Tax=Cypionkella sp. TWP1-2-1b2 TaxID=2804675 RepID=UPI003CEAAF78
MDILHYRAEQGFTHPAPAITPHGLQPSHHAPISRAVGFDDCIAWAAHIAQGLESPGAAAAEPAVRRLVDGLAHRSRALRLLGNGVHPLGAAYAWRALASAHGLGPLDLATGKWAERPGPDESF